MTSIGSAARKAMVLGVATLAVWAAVAPSSFGAEVSYVRAGGYSQAGLQSTGQAASTWSSSFEAVDNGSVATKAPRGATSLQDPVRSAVEGSGGFAPLDPAIIAAAAADRATLRYASAGDLGGFHAARPDSAAWEGAARTTVGSSVQPLLVADVR